MIRVVCDVCDREADVRVFYADRLELPRGWETRLVDQGQDTAHVCPRCVRREQAQPNKLPTTGTSPD